MILDFEIIKKNTCKLKSVQYIIIKSSDIEFLKGENERKIFMNQIK